MHYLRRRNKIKKENYTFLLKNLHMSKKYSNFAVEIETINKKFKNMGALNLANMQVKFLEQDEYLKYYMKQIRRYKAPTDEEEKAMFEAYHNGDQTMRDEIILHNQRFVFSIAKIYARDNSELNDYVNEGNFGLIEAIDKYNPECGTKFLTFAVWYIRRNMNYYLINRRDSIVKSNAMKLFKKVDKIVQAFYAENGINPTNEEIKQCLKEKYDIVIEDDRDLYDLDITSINEEVDDDYTVEDTSDYNEATAVNPDSEDNDEKEYNKSLANMLLKYIDDEQDREIIKKMYGIGYEREYTIGEISQEYKITEEGLNKLRDSIFEKIRNKFDNNQFVA